MATKMRLELHSPGIREVLLSDGMRSLVDNAALAVARNAARGTGLSSGTSAGADFNVMATRSGRARAFVLAASAEAKEAQAASKSLSKAVR